MNIHYVLMVSFYQSDNSLRTEELIFALSENVRNRCISRIIVFNESNENPIESDKITYVDVSAREQMTYKDFFEYANEHLVGERCILANADIVITEDIMKLSFRDLEGVFICLSRWDKGGGQNNVDGIQGGDSQDTWIFMSPVKQGLVNDSDYTLGVLFSDSALSYLAIKNGYIPWNPAKDVVTNHIHQTGYRPYKSPEVQAEALDVTDGHYTILDPTHIEEEIKTRTFRETGRSREV